MNTALIIIGCWLTANVVFVFGMWLGNRHRHLITGKSSAMVIPFTQYLRPHGSKKAIYYTTDDKEIAAMASLILARGYVFECELLATGEVSLTITDPDNGDLDIRVVPNGPAVPDAVMDLIRNFVAPAGRMIQ